MRFRARGRVRGAKVGMNKTEAKYAERMEAWKADTRVQWYAFEAIKLRLADKTFYTPDFCVMMSDGLIEFHEVKGFWEDDARVKIKVAAAQYPLFTFRAFRPAKGGVWEEEVF